LSLLVSFIIIIISIIIHTHQVIFQSPEQGQLSTGEFVLNASFAFTSQQYICSAVASAAVLSPGCSSPFPLDADQAVDSYDFVTSDARRFKRSVGEGTAQDGIDAGGSGSFGCVREAHARAFALAHASVIVLTGLQQEKEAGQHQQRARSPSLSREVACIEAALADEWRRHTRAAQLESGAADGGAASGWCESARAMRWFALPFDGLKLSRAGLEASVEGEWENCVWSKILNARDNDLSSFAFSEGEWLCSIWSSAWSQQLIVEHSLHTQQRLQLQLKRETITQEQSAVVIHPVPASEASRLLPTNSYIQFLTHNLQRLVPLHPRATFFELCRITGALWNSNATPPQFLGSPLQSSSGIAASSLTVSTAGHPLAPESSDADVTALLHPQQPQQWLIKPVSAARQPSSLPVGPNDSGRAKSVELHLSPAVNPPLQVPFSRHPLPPPSQKATQLLGSKIRKLMTKASKEFDMIREGDRVLVGLSGGKDSLTMLVLLLELQRRAPFKFSVAACTIEPGAAEFDPSPLKAYVTPQLGIPYFFESDTIIQRAKSVSGKFSICAYCARQKRGMLYSAALREGYNVLALAQHADDLAESFLMSAMHNGRLRTMKASTRVLHMRDFL
jgi:hypothetical protein